MRSRFFLIAGLVALLIPAAAWGKTDRADLSLNHPARISGAELKPGDYEIIANAKSGQARILHHGKLVAKVQGKWISLDKKASDTQVVLSQNMVEEIRFAGQTRALEFR